MIKASITKRTGFAHKEERGRFVVVRSYNMAKVARFKERERTPMRGKRGSKLCYSVDKCMEIWCIDNMAS
jgi:hypothetical protein